jgi:chloramphenicol-sensitive protein RarD
MEMNNVTQAETTAPTVRPTDTKGILLALAAYGLWGAFPFYFMLLGDAGPLEIVGHRVLWSLVFCLIGVIAWRALAELRAVLRSPRLLTGLMVAGVLVSVNWLVYVWGVLNDHIVDTALGYFINPLFTVTLAVLVLRERLRPAQWAAVGIGTAAVIVIAIGYGQVPWVALVLATTFGLYGLAKNRVGGRVSPLVGLTVETGGISPVAFGYLVWLQATGASSFIGHGPGHSLLLVGAGAVTAVPLLLFAGAASRIPLSMMGLIQYVAPVIQFGIGVWVNHEVMPLPRWIGFGLVWVALIILTIDSLRAARNRPIPVEPDNEPASRVGDPGTDDDRHTAVFRVESQP